MKELEQEVREMRESMAKVSSSSSSKCTANKCCASEKIKTDLKAMCRAVSQSCKEPNDFFPCVSRINICFDVSMLHYKNQTIFSRAT
jgi:hypothetical protein